MRLHLQTKNELNTIAGLMVVPLGSENMKFRLVILMVLSTAAALSVKQTYLNLNVLPPKNANMNPVLVTSSDHEMGGSSTISLLENSYDKIRVRYTLSDSIPFPYATLGLFPHNEINHTSFNNWSGFTHIHFAIACHPNNTLTFSLNTFDRKVTDPEDFNTFRKSVSSFKCQKETTEVSIDLRDLETPEWWLKLNKLELTDTEYALDQVYSFSIVNSSQSPVGQESGYTLTRITLTGRNWTAVYLAGALSVAVVCLLVYWLINSQKSRLLRHVGIMQTQEIPAVVYKEVQLDEKKDREISAILAFMGTKYTDSNLNLEDMAASLGINRTKINNLLKARIGLTFSTYLNKLRLDEAARLLRLNTDASVAETAYAVGYRNTSYFNTIFKKQFGCTPNAFKRKNDE